MQWTHLGWGWGGWGACCRLECFQKPQLGHSVMADDQGLEVELRVGAPYVMGEVMVRGQGPVLATDGRVLEVVGLGGRVPA